ncbi:hypothetical protein ACG0Z6_11835 [Roseateles sp. BYS180W]|uniref:DUF3108 domain-containing protein n=1 Tax=Roseateles rivi TaxID=3299028 RepID=A0ABW7FXA2_9BURK
MNVSGLVSVLMSSLPRAAIVGATFGSMSAVAVELPEPLLAARDKALARGAMLAAQVDNQVGYQMVGRSGRGEARQTLSCWEAKKSRARREAAQPVSEEVEGALDLAPPLPLNPADAPHRLLLELETVKLREGGSDPAKPLEYEGTGSLGKKKVVQFDALIKVDRQRQELLTVRYRFKGIPMTRKLDYQIDWSDTPQGWLPVQAEYSVDMRMLLLLSAQIERRMAFSGWVSPEARKLAVCDEAKS